MREAETIYRAHLDRVTRAVWGRDYAAGARAMLYPHRQVSPEERTILMSHEEMVQQMRLFREQMETLGATDYARRVLTANFYPCESDRIGGTHRTLVLRHGRPVMTPYVGGQLLRCVNGEWLCEARILHEVPQELRHFHPESPRQSPPGGENE